MAANKQASTCANHACNASLHEGHAALYDDCRDAHFCDRACFDEWFGETVAERAAEYRRDNVSEVDL